MEVSRCDPGWVRPGAASRPAGCQPARDDHGCLSRLLRCCSTTETATPTAPALQVVIDAVDPHAPADFWAAALGYVVEDVEAFARQMMDAGHARGEDVTHHRGHLVWRDATAASDPAGQRPRLLVQRVPETKTVKNRVHLDLHVGPERRDAEVERVVGLGARRLYDGRLGPQGWVTLADPEGNELCIS